MSRSRAAPTGTRRATGVVPRAIVISAPCSTSASKAERCVLASCTFTVLCTD